MADKALLKARKEKRWLVFSKAHVITPNGTSGNTVQFYDTVYGKDDTQVSNYISVSSASRTAWVLELETTSFKLAKAKVVELASSIGLDNVKLDRVVDLTTVFYPIA